METLTEYEVRITFKLLNLPLNKWYKISPDREDLEMFLMTVESRYYTFGDFEFRNDKSEFRRIKERDEYDAKNYTGEITYHIEWKEQSQVEIDYSHLPAPKYTEEKKIVKRRAV
jgi:hypothetical protein